MSAGPTRSSFRSSLVVTRLNPASGGSTFSAGRRSPTSTEGAYTSSESLRLCKFRTPKVGVSYRL